MENILNKPRVFLSHSKKDTEFINILYSDLLRCQINPWIDEIEIRHGKPWLESIFENGIPTCDSVLVYLTENSIESQMVKKEIDATLIAELADNSIAFLPYVSSTDIRQKLRLDLQTLHIKEWNQRNYKEILACVVAEIWRSFMERSVKFASQSEQNKRLKLELEIQNLKANISNSNFSKAEESDFTYIFSCFNKQLKFHVSEYELCITVHSFEKGKEIQGHQFTLSLGDLISQLIFINNTDFKVQSLRKVLKDNCIKLISKNGKIVINDQSFEIKEFEDINSQLLTYGLVKGDYIQEQRYASGRNSTSYRSAYYRYPFTEKFYRFRYWLEFNNRINKDLVITYLDDENLAQ